MTISDRVWSRIVTMCGRKTYFQPDLDTNLDYSSKADRIIETDLDRANLVSSELPNGLHAPVLDIDFGAHLIPSSTPGKYHLYLDKQIPWADYRDLLDAFYRVGMIEKGWYENAIRDKRTYVRLPHIHKPTPDTGEDGLPHAIAF